MRAIIVGILLVWSLPLAAQEQPDHKRKSQEFASMWTCAVLAQQILKIDDHDRLFRTGYFRGKEVLEALKKGNLKWIDLKAPISLGIVLEGPTDDFKLGAAWRHIYERTLDELVFVHGGDRFSQVSREYADRNCDLLR